MKKSKFLKTFSFTSLALLMGVAGTMAFAPLGAGPNNLANASEMVDQINTKADGENIKYAPSALGLDPENDPVIYTTESGLEIKYGGESVSDQLASGKPLSGYPYFTMGTYSGYAVNWVIIGRNTNDTVFTSTISAHLYSTWKTNNSASSATFENKGYYFFNNTYETTTPAGSAINGVVPSKSYVADVTKATKTVVGNDEVPQGCVLAISECCLGYSYFNSTATANTSYCPTTAPTNNYGGRYRYRADNNNSSRTQAFTHTYNNKYDGTLYTYINNLYSTNLGLTTAQKNLIQGQKLSTVYANASKHLLDTSDTDGNTVYNLFPLAGPITKGQYWSSHSSYGNPGTESFAVATYLSTIALRKAYAIGGSTTSIDYWIRMCETGYASCGGTVGTNGNGDGNIDGCWSGCNFGVRPAGVFKLG